ncbi:MAG: sigma-70 family RNA polymerase sigma factor [Ruminococcaceae bacterium]|nr:sigma-70 family RNA polymerase sigma factor [Oscillospiraceae bacterium]
MSYNNKKAYNEFKKYIRKEKCFMKNTGMSEEDISEIHSLTVKQFNEDNKYQRTTVSLDLYIEDMYEESQNPIYNNSYIAVEIDFSKYSYYGWIQEVKDERILEAIRRLNKKDLFILSEIVIYNQSIRNVAESMGLSRQWVHGRYKRIIKKLSGR